MIKSDSWIRSKCQQKTGTLYHAQEKGSGTETMSSLYGKTVEEREAEIRKIIGDESFINQQYSYIPVRLSEPAVPFVPMIEPYEPKNVRYEDVPVLASTTLSVKHMNEHERKIFDEKYAPRKILSYGTSSFGYDVTLSDKFQIFTNINSSIIDPLNFDEKCLQEFQGDVCIIPPNSYILGVTREYFKIPRNVMVVCVGKSTYARCGAIVNVTPIEPGFEGNVVIEISNATNLPMKIYANQGVAQFLFFESDEECETSYADKGGKYQGQRGLVLAKG